MNSLHWHKRERKDGGFTLLEVLMATLMYAVIVGAMYSVFYGALRLRENAYETFEKELPHHQAVETIRRDLYDIVPEAGILAGSMIGENEEEMNLSFGRLEFHTASGRIDRNYPWGDIQRVEYALREAGDRENSNGFIMVRLLTRNLLAPIEEEPFEERLLRDVRSLNFSFYDGQDWLDSWDSALQEGEMPLALGVRIEFQIPEEYERETIPIELIVPIVTKARAVIEGEEGEESDTTEMADDTSAPGSNTEGPAQGNLSEDRGTGGGRP